MLKLKKRMLIIMLTLSLIFQSYGAVAASGPMVMDGDGTAAGLSTNLLVNGGFEETVSGANWVGNIKPSGWGQWLASGTPILAVDNVVKHSGKQSASIEGPVGKISRAAITQGVPVEIGKTYRISGWVRTEDVSNNALIRFQMKRSGTYNLLINIGTLKGDSDWKYMERLLTVPDNAAMPAILTIEMFLEAGTGKVWFDDIKVEEPLKSLSVAPKIAYLGIGEGLAPTVSFVPESASNKRLTWSSSNPEVAAVSEHGVITGVSAGEALITATAEDGGYKDSLIVSIGAPETLSVEPYTGEAEEDGLLSGRIKAVDSTGAEVKFALAVAPEKGIMTLQPDGNFTYFPNENYYGTDTFQFTARTSSGGPRFGTGTITVTEMNDPPVLDLEWKYTPYNTALEGEVLKKAEDPDKDALVWSIVGSPSNGTAEVNKDGTFRYVPAQGFLGYDRLCITAEDGRGGRTEKEFMIFVGPGVSEIAGAREAYLLKQAHPSLLATESDFQKSRALIASGDKYMTEWFNILKERADAVLESLPLSYAANGGNTYSLIDRLIPASLMYQLTGDARYAERVWKEFEAMTQYAEWGGRTNNILALSELSFAVALAYDWTYDYMSDEQRSLLNAAIRDKALATAQQWYRGEFRHNGEFNNINLVDNGGLGLLALAVVDEQETQSAALEVIQGTFVKLQTAVRHYTQDGSWPEGPAYWHYGGQYLAMYIAGLNTAIGTDFGLSDLPGYEASGAFPYHLLGEEGFFNFYDGGISYNLYESLWFAKFFENPEYAWYVGDLYRRKGAFHPLFMIFYEPGMFDVQPAELDRFFTGIESGSMRSAWNDPYALFASMKGVNETMRSHNDLDAGSFVFDGLGVRWATDLGNESYSLPGFWDYNYTRWTYYRKKTEGHSTIVLNPAENTVLQQEPYGTATTLRNESKPRGAFTILDMTDVYTKDASEMLRGMMLASDRSELIIQDEMKLKKPSEVYWFMHTPASVEIIENGRAAVLHKQDKKLYVQLVEAPAGAVFSVMDAAPLPDSPNPSGQSSNEGIRKLAIHLKDVQEVALSVRMVPYYEYEPQPQPVPYGSYTPLSEWSIPEGELPVKKEAVTASAILLNGRSLEGFNPKVTYYDVKLPFDKPLAPVVEAVSEHLSTVTQDVYIPGSSKVTIRNTEDPTDMRVYTINFTRLPAIGEPPAFLKYPVADVTASAVPEAANVPRNTIDGRLDTRWSASGTEYIQFDLGEPKKVGAISLAIYLGNTRTNYFDVLASNDGVEWKTIYADGITSGISDKPETFLVEETVARYIRILGKGNNANPWNSISEVGIYPLAPLVMRVDAPEKIMIDESQPITVKWGYPMGIQIPADKGIIFSSDRPEVLEAAPDGTVTAKLPGMAAVTVTDTVYGFVQQVYVTVTLGDNASYLRIQGTPVMESKEDQQLSVQLIFADGSVIIPESLRYISDRPQTVSVDANGIVRANQSGTAVITVTDRATGVSNKISIKVP